MEVRTGDQVLIGGFIINGTAPKKVILRAIGPSLGAFGIPDPLADPILELHGSDSSLITTNDNWKDSDEAAISATGLAPGNDLDQAAASQLGNISTRGFVESGSNVMIGGFILGGASGNATSSSGRWVPLSRNSG